MICIEVGIARNFEIIILDVAHVWNYTTYDPLKKPTMFANIVGWSPGSNPRSCARRSHARARLRTMAKAKASKANELAHWCSILVNVLARLRRLGFRV
jgi:hypothetical protein